MNCRKCGCELQENDMFCAECGEKAEPVDVEKPEEECSNVSKNEKLPVASNKKTKVTVAVVIVVAIIAAGLAIFLPKTVEMEAGELGQIIYTDEIEGYYQDTLVVHGYLLRDGDRTALYTDIDEEGVVFVYEEGLDESLGDGSELIVMGSIGYKKDAPSANLLLADSVEVVKATERTYHINSVADLLTSADEYFDREIIVTGIVNCSQETNYDLRDDADSNKVITLAVDLKDQSALQTYGLYNITGELSLEGKELTLKVINYEMIQEMEECFSFDGVDALMDSAWECKQKKVKVYAKAYMLGYEHAVLHGSRLDIDLTGLTNDQVISIDGKVVTIIGTLKGGVGDPYFIEVEDIVYDRAI